MKSKSFRVHPATLFFLLSVLLVLVVWVLDVYGVSIFNPHTGKFLRLQSLLNAEGARWVMRNTISNFSSFSPVAMVVTSLLGVGVAESSGFIDSLANRLTVLQNHPKYGLALMILLGILSNVVGDAGYVFLVPLLAIIAPRIGIHPVMAIIVTLVSVSCGYSANWMLSSMDPLLARITQDTSVHFIPQDFNTGSYANYYFMGASTCFLTGVIYIVSQYILKPQLKRKGFVLKQEKQRLLSHREIRSLHLALGIGLAFLVIIGWLTFSSIGLFRGVSGELVRSPFIMGALFILSLSVGLMGLVYGFSIGKYKNDYDVVSGLSWGIRTLGIFFVIAFFAAQFFAYVSYTHFDQFVVLWVGKWVSSFAITSPTLALIVFIAYCALVNLTMVSAVGKWVLISALFLPMFWGIGVDPNVVQAAFRVGDSATNVVTPFLYYTPFILALLEKYIPKAGFKFIFNHTWYFSLIVLFTWMILFLIWFQLGLPFGV